MPDPLPNRVGRIGYGDRAYSSSGMKIVHLFTSFIPERLVISHYTVFFWPCKVY